MLKIRLLTAAGAVLGDAEIVPNPAGNGLDLPDVATFAGLTYVLDRAAAFPAGDVAAVYRFADVVAVSKVSAPVTPAKVEQTRTGARMELAAETTSLEDAQRLADAARGR